MNKQKIIDAILSRDTLALRRITGKFDGVPVLCYLDNGTLRTFDPDGSPLQIQPPTDRTPEAWEDFLIDHNVLFFNSNDEMESFLLEGKPIPQHTYNGLPPWVWLVK